MRLNEIEVGGRIDIHFEHNGETVKTKSIVDGTTDNGIEILAPIYRMRLVIPEHGELVSVILHCGGLSHKWKCKHEKLLKKEPLKMLSLYCEDDSISCNRRKAYRVEVIQDIRYKFVNKVYRGTITEISLAGVKVLSDIEHSVGDVIEFDIQVNKSKIHIQSEVVRQSRKYSSIYRYEYGVNISNDVDRELSKYINDVQRLKLQRRHIDKLG